MGIDNLGIIESTLDTKSQAYTEMMIYRKGKQREIKSLKKNSDLYLLQKRLAENFLNNIPLPNNVCGFVKNNSYKDFLLPHNIKDRNKTRYYLRLDIADFFNSISEEKVRKTIDEYITINNEEEKNSIISAIVGLVTFNGCLPQGGVTSPVISNLVFRRIDLRIRNYCDKLGIIYTRYADDMLFSANRENLHKGSFIKMLINILKGSGFVLNRKKIKRGINFISLNGFVVGNNVRISRSKRKEINRFIYNYEKGGIPKTATELLSKLNGEIFSSRIKPFETKTDIIHYLAGYRSFLILWLPENKEDNWYRESTKLLDKINKIIKRLESLN
ncbi:MULTISPECIES: reverse transcriptase family protein [unclassified Mesobacillus]|uniref:reverse transcriptase family protein n=1 Tax=unclassified Mesobacillus TaxID=2675270 RepID=UPI00203B09E3|nr:MULTISPECIES: reverse transcriptase family protein [unclassified Mesobacillus]MCM3124432.1 reverse transcriptase family protein [Mesobacillus sp. MER 33]MCM3234858.1 reverse transcriptase family protein [Mesobacillus sp. MER 48]